MYVSETSWPHTSVTISEGAGSGEYGGDLVGKLLEQQLLHPLLHLDAGGQ